MLYYLPTGIAILVGPAVEFMFVVTFFVKSLMFTINVKLSIQRFKAQYYKLNK